MTDNKDQHSNETITVATCEVCGERNLTSVLNLGPHPMCDDLVPVGSDRICNEYPIEILYCDTCFTAHQKFQVPKKELFPKTYHYRSRFTADVLNGMKDLVNSCESKFGSLAGKKVLDIGCNDGSLLTFFKEKDAETYGIEPTDAYLDAVEKEHTVMNNFLSLESADEFVSKYGNADLITFTNVFAHIENLQEVIDSLKKVMHGDSILVIENHYLGSIIAGNQFDTFYHEHPRTYSYKSFEYIAKSLGLAMSGVHFTARYGGNIRVYISNVANKESIKQSTDELIERESKFGSEIREMQEKIEKWVVSKKEEIAALVEKHGKLRVKAFPGRAAILVKLLSLSDKEILCVYEKPGSMKIDHYLPGTRIPIVSDEELFKDKENPAPIINLAWHIPKEIGAYLTNNGVKGELINIITETDFKK
jgi:SAM-dependent methyltransferase